MSLAGRNILITGAGDGLGRATAIACAQQQAGVVLLGRTVKKLEAVYDAIRAAGGPEPAPEPAIYPLNLAGANWNDYLELAATLERELGTLHGLIHCAAHFKEFRPLQDLEPKDWLEALQVNLTAPYALTRACLPLLQKSAGASVVFVTHPASTAQPYSGAYGVSKSALETLARTWSAELAPAAGVRVSTYDPGPLRTNLRARGYPGESPERNIPPESAVPALLKLLA